MRYFSRIILALIVGGSTLWLLAAAARTPAAQDSEVQFQRAVQLETIEGDLNAAIDLYQQLINNNGHNRALAAKALLRLGGCYEKQGNEEARKTYERLLSDYADQSESAAEARTRLAALRKPAKPGSGPSTRRIWAESKTDFFGQVSPDGRYLSFVDWDTGDLAVRDLEKGTNRRLTNKGSWESNSDDEAEYSIWSPDSRQIAYQWSTLHGYELRLISLDNPTPRMLFRCEDSQVGWIDPYDWSPDGKQILAALNTNGADQQMVLISVADGTVHLLKKFSQSMSLARAIISPDGHYVVYDYPQNESSLAHDILLLPTDGGSETPLIEYPSDDVAVGWSPDGKWVLFASDRRGSIDVWAIEMEGGKPKGEPVMVKPAVGPITPLGLTRSGSLYYGVGGADCDVYVAKLDSATGRVLASPTKLVKQFEGFNHSPSYSPDGRYLAYVSVRARTKTSAGWGDTLCIRSLETREEREYPHDLRRLHVRIVSRPRWSPDGQSLLLFGRDYSGRYGIYHINVETGNAECIVRQQKDLWIGYSEGWRDTNSFVYGNRSEKDDRGQIILRNIDSGDEKVLHQGALSDMVRGEYSVSRDGKWISTLGRLKSGATILMIKSTEDGAEKKQFKFSQKELLPSLHHWWSADDKYLFCIGRVGLPGISYKFEVWRISLETGKLERTDLEMPGLIINLSAHPDGEHIAFENMAPMSESPAEVWALENFMPK
jgi:Tol biopolymer transport system component